MTDDECVFLCVLQKAARKTDDLAPLYVLGNSDQSLSYLDGSLPGDYGFDPLGLSDPEGAGGFINPCEGGASPCPP